MCATSLSPTALSSVCCCTLLFWTNLSVQTVKCAVAYFFGLLCTRAIKYLRQKYVFWDAPIHCVETGTAAQQHCKAVCLSNTSPDLFSFIRAATSGSRRVSERRRILKKMKIQLYYYQRRQMHQRGPPVGNYLSEPGASKVTSGFNLYQLSQTWSR